MQAQDMLKRITVEAGKCGGRPCVRGCRIRVADVLELLANGADTEEILEDYPFLEAADVQACVLYASIQADHPVVASAS